VTVDDDRLVFEVVVAVQRGQVAGVAARALGEPQRVAPGGRGVERCGAEIGSRGRCDSRILAVPAQPVLEQFAVPCLVAAQRLPVGDEPRVG
jgi:hypothetical protein